MRNNENRINSVPQAPKDSEVSPVLAATKGNSDFSFIAANDIVELPSRGEFYPNGHPLKENPVVEVKQMTAKEEDILLNQSYLKQGVTIDKLLDSLVATKSFKLDDLLIGDKNAILTQIRRSAYGDEYPVETVCRSCMSKSETVFNLEECVYDKPSELLEGVEKTEKNTFVFTAPKTKAKIEIKLLTSSDEKAIAEKQAKYKKHNVEFSAMLELYKTLIISVNDDPTLVSSYVENMPLKDLKYLKEVFKAAQPGVDLRGVFTCNSCDTEVEMDLPINFRFLWPDI